MSFGQEVKCVRIRSSCALTLTTLTGHFSHELHLANVASVSELKSVTLGTLICIRAAIVHGGAINSNPPRKQGPRVSRALT